MSSTTQTTQFKSSRGALQYAPIPWKPAQFQKRGVKFLIEHAAGGLLLDPGMRKTSTTLAAFKMLKEHYGVAERMLVVAPRRPLHLVWPAEIDKWLDFCELRYAFLHGDKKELNIDTEADIFLTTPDTLEWLLTKPANNKRGWAPDTSKLKRLGVDTLCVDECTKFKNTSSNRFHYLKHALGRFGRRWILTGTFAPNGLMDLFGQVYIMDQGNALGRYITNYRQRWFIPTGFGGYDWRIKDEKAEKEIHKAIAPMVMRLNADDYLDLPQLVESNILVDLPTDVRKAYDELEDDMFTYLDTHKVTALSAGVASMKCEQLASGNLYKNAGDRVGNIKKDVIKGHTEKLDALADLIEQRQGRPTLILYWFEHEAEAIIKKLGKGGAWLGRGQGASRERGIQNAWNRDELPWLLGQPQSIAHGLNLQEGSADALAWYTLTWDLELYEQTIRRLRRSGSQHKLITCHRIIARNTVDDAKLIALAAKDRTQRTLHDAIEKYRSKHGKARRH